MSGFYKYAAAARAAARERMRKNEVINRWNNKLNHPNFKDIVNFKDFKFSFDENLIFPLYKKELSSWKYNKKKRWYYLLYGYQGVGKTLLAHAVANEIHAPYFEFSCLDNKINNYNNYKLIDLEVIFNKIRKLQTAVIILKDFDKLNWTLDKNIDKLSYELIATIKRLNFHTTTNLIVFGLTSYPWNVDLKIWNNCDFSKIFIDLPNTEIRKAMFKKILKELPIEDDINWDQLAEYTKNCNWNDINKFCELLKDIVINQAIKQNIEDISNLKITNIDIKIVGSSFKSSINIELLDKIRKWNK